MENETSAKKRKADFGSLRIRLWLYFGLFAAILIVMLWMLQVFFLNYNYEDMKTSETRSIAEQIEVRVRDNGLSPDTRNFINDLCDTYDLYIQIETKSGVRSFMPNVDTSTQTDASGNEIEELPTEEEPRSYYPTIYRQEIEVLKSELVWSGQKNFSKQTLEPNTDQKTLEYASFLENPIDEAKAKAAAEAAAAAKASAEATAEGEFVEPPSDSPVDNSTEILPTDDEEGEALTEEEAEYDPLMLFIFSPLYPVGSTLKILMTQLVYVTIIAFLLALLLGFYLSRMITQPIIQIAKRAQELGDGNFGIDFPQEHYSEVKRLAETLNYTSQTLAETRTMQRDVIANVSHDLRTPLTMIRSYAEMLLDFSGDDPEKRKTHLNTIIGETDRLDAMITELLDISKLQSGEKQINLTTFSLKSLIEQSIESYSAFADQNGYTLSLDAIGDGIITADETRIKQVVDNLISNALKYGGKNKRVEIKMKEEPGEPAFVRCEITDFGVGISKRDLKHIWERYYRASIHYSRADSAGLGLSIVKEILVLHKARFGATSELHKGSTFWFEIPTEIEPPEAQPESQEASEQESIGGNAE